MIKIVCISDTHGLHNEMKYSIPECDILIHAGDSSRNGSKESCYEFLDWFAKQSGKYKFLIPGNHDFYYEKITREDILYILACNKIHLLIDDWTICCGVKIYGSPWTNKFFDWAFMKEEEALQQYWNAIGSNTDILVTHGPPYTYLDMTNRGVAAGSKSLAETIKNKIHPKYHIFGHIHEAYGISITKETTYINASICNLKYQPINKPIEVYI